MLLGIQVSTEGKIFDAFQRAHDLGCNTMQIFSRNPQRWRDRALEPADIEEFKKKQKQFGIKPVFIHIPYLFNLASPDIRLYKDSIRAYIEDVREVADLKADYIVTHMGSHKKTSEKEGLKRLTGALNTILEKTRDCGVGILLENTAGSGSWLGYTFHHHRVIMNGLQQKKRVGLCLDTAHAYLAGYDLASEEGLKAMLDEIDTTVGLELLKLVHLNDAKDKLGSHHDRHEHIGKGKIGLQGMRRIINHPRLRNLAFVLETPKDSEEADRINLNTVRKLRKE
jgi:deoxyribonuclease-4